MSKRIEQILEVIEETRIIFDREDTTIQNARIRAVENVADRHGLTRTTVEDKFMRWLRPDVQVADDFDALLEDLLIDDYPGRLRSVLLNFARDTYDEERIEAAFGRIPKTNDVIDKTPSPETPTDGFKEGRPNLKLHLQKERNRELTKRAKDKWSLEQNGNIRCSACSFSFLDTYGEIGRNFIEAHHVQPISSLTSDTVVYLSDLAPVCSNCHRILHRHRPLITISQLRDLLARQR
jgi:hypothetical protein